MSLLRIRIALREVPERCQWVFIGHDVPGLPGAGTLAELPRNAVRAQVIIAADGVLLTRARLPAAARRDRGSVLAFAVEEQVMGDPGAGLVTWLGVAGDQDALAVLDRMRLGAWLDALEAVGIRAPEVYCETLLLPRVAGAWSLAWDGREGFLRSGEFEGAATDRGDDLAPPLMLRLMLDEARERGDVPDRLQVHAVTPAPLPDLDAWQHALGIPVEPGAPWDWRHATAQADGNLAPPRRRWRPAPGMLRRLQPAAVVLGAVLALHMLALALDWMLLAREQRALRQEMVARFQATFPDAVAVVDPELQLQRKLTAARHRAGEADRGDFLPLLGQIAAAADGLPAGAIRALTYDGGRLTLELAGVDEAALQRVVAHLAGFGLAVDLPSAAGSAGAAVVITVRPS